MHGQWRELDSCFAAIDFAAESVTMTNKDPDLKSGRAAFDDRGQSTWEWRVDTGTFSRQIDTQRLKQIQEQAGVTLKEDPPPPAGGINPYSAPTPLPPETKKRRTLDDMRKLSEEIKRNRERK